MAVLTGRDDAEFIAACDPDTILALIAEIESLRGRVCASCRYWRTLADKSIYSGFGVCGKIGATGRQIVQSDFGCSEWEAKE